MIGVDITCPNCGQPMGQIAANSQPTGVTAKAIITCPNGHRRLLNVTLHDTTEAPYRRSDETPAQHADRLHNQGKSLTEAANLAGINRGTHYRHRQRNQA